MLIKLGDALHIAADQIAKIWINPYGMNIDVCTKDGKIHSHPTPYGISIYKERDRIVEEVNSVQGERK